ncbi:unnamed protein product [Diamesa serratosioi]
MTTALQFECDVEKSNKQFDCSFDTIDILGKKFDSIKSHQFVYSGNENGDLLTNDSFVKAIKFQHSELDHIPSVIFTKFINYNAVRVIGGKLGGIFKDDFELAPKLKYFYAPATKLTKIPDEAFVYAIALEAINLEYNEITSIGSNAFKGLDKLRVLDLTSNKITRLEQQFFDNLPKPFENGLSLTSNELDEETLELCKTVTSNC